MKLELRVPLSPTPSFLNRALLMTASFRRFHPDAIVQVYVGEAAGPKQESMRLVEQTFTGKKIGWTWVRQKDFDMWDGTRSPYLATMNSRFHQQCDGDAIIIADGDVIFTGPLTPLFETNAVQGVQAHVPPLTDAEWIYLSAIVGAPRPRFEIEYSGAGIMCPPETKGPWYANSGFCFAPTPLFQKMCEPYHQTINLMHSAMRDTYWFDQLALSLGAAKAGVPTKSLPLRYNFPNQPAFDDAHPDELADCRVLHYLRTDIVNRDAEFASQEAIAAFTKRTDLSGSNELLRKHVSIAMGELGWS